MKRILIISLSPIDRDPRVLRQIQFLEDDFEITVVGLTSPNIKGVKFIQVNIDPPKNFFRKLYELLLAFLGFFDYLYWKQRHIQWLKHSLDKIVVNAPEIVIGNDAQILPLVVSLSKKWNAYSIIDLHEYAPLELEDVFRWRLRFKRYYYFLLKKYLPKSDFVMTVCGGIQEKIFKEFKVKSEVLTNAPYYEELFPSKVNPDRIRIVHHGGAMRSRNLHLMIEMMNWLDSRFELNLILMDSDVGYLDELKEMSKSNSRIIFHELVPTKKISSFINQFDIGICVVPPINFNYAVGLPNKFFEFIQARLCIAVGPSVEMMTLTKRYDLGVISNDFSAESMASTLNALSLEEIKLFKNNSNRIASLLSANKNKELFLSIIKKCNS